jgi:hypoxanthine phosphoribosyltransferase
MKKEFLSYETVRNDSIMLAHRMYTDGFVPDVIYVSLRGGAYVGNVVSEYYKTRSHTTHPVYYAAVVARSYVGVATANEIKVEGWTFSPESIRTGDKILLVDDIFDSGQTLNHLASIILNRGIPRSDLKVAVHDYKYFYDREVQLPVQPDYWCRRHDLSVHDEPMWIHYESHELIGLTDEELEEHYFAKCPELRAAL